jgi:hypothetical protein
MSRLARPFLPQIVSANDLLDGGVIYLAATGGWTRRLAEAAVARSPAEAAALMAAAETQPDIAVGPALAEVATGHGAPRPLAARELIRALGPTIRRAHAETR